MSRWPWRSFCWICARSRSLLRCWFANPVDGLSARPLTASCADILAVPDLLARSLVESPNRGLQDLSPSIQQGAARCLWHFRHRQTREDHRECPARDGSGELRSGERGMSVSAPLGWPSRRRPGQETASSRRDHFRAGRYHEQERTSAGAYRHGREHAVKTCKRWPHHKCPRGQGTGRPSHQVACQSASGLVQIISGGIRIAWT